MRFSIFTPTHDAKHLLETYDSLLTQTFRDWEWVIVPNNGAILPKELDDTRIRIVTPPLWVARLGVGGLKWFACQQSQGDYLVELDHDDRLLPLALERIDEAITTESPDFIYSDNARLEPDGGFELFGKEHGWENYHYRCDDKVYQVNSSFQVNAASLRAIFYAPDHIRVWKRDAYHGIGGHDATMPVCDDYDLLCRTYLAGLKIHHIPECLYIYRIQNGGNTWLKRNAEIQSKQQEVSNRYLYPLIDEWCRRFELPRVNLGGNAPEGYIDASLKNGFDLTKGYWPFGEASIGVIRAYDFLNHVPHCKPGCKHVTPLCTVGVMNEIHRVLVPGGWLLCATPSTDGRGAFQDPTTASWWNPNSFFYVTREQQRQYIPHMTARFQKARVWQEFPSEWHKENAILYVYADLIALKGQRQPGICEV